MYIFMHICIYTYMQKYIDTCIYIYTCVHKYMSYIYRYKRIYTCAYTYIHIHINIHMPHPCYPSVGDMTCPTPSHSIPQRLQCDLSHGRTGPMYGPAAWAHFCLIDQLKKTHFIA